MRVVPIWGAEVPCGPSLSWEWEGEMVGWGKSDEEDGLSRRPQSLWSWKLSRSYDLFKSCLTLLFYINQTPQNQKVSLAWNWLCPVARQGGNFWPFLQQCSEQSVRTDLFLNHLKLLLQTPRAWAFCTSSLPRPCSCSRFTLPPIWHLNFFPVHKGFVLFRCFPHSLAFSSPGRHYINLLSKYVFKG
jgi:hypothetical protein